MSGKDTLSQAEIDALLAAVAADPKDTEALRAQVQARQNVIQVLGVGWLRERWMALLR